MSRELIEGNELESHDEKIKVMKENQNQGRFSAGCPDRSVIVRSDNHDCGHLKNVHMHHF